MFDLAIDSKLRVCDLVKIRIGDIAEGGEIRRRASVIQQKTGRPVQFEITETARESLTAWLELRGGSLEDHLFPSRQTRCRHIGTRQYARLVNEWVAAIGLPPEEYGTHSLRRTKASLIYKKTGNLRAVQILSGHTKIESTVRYLGVDVEDALDLAEGTDVWFRVSPADVGRNHRRRRFVCTYLDSRHQVYLSDSGFAPKPNMVQPPVRKADGKSLPPVKYFVESCV